MILRYLATSRSLPVLVGAITGLLASSVCPVVVASLGG